LVSIGLQMYVHSVIAESLDSMDLPEWVRPGGRAAG
jgi:hypothetical protein